MFKKHSRKAALLIAILMVVTVVMAGCGGDKDADSDKGSSDATKTSYKYGFNTWGAGVPILDSFGDATQWVIEAIGDTGVRASDDFTADKEIQNVQNFISQGVDGVVLEAAAPSAMLTMADALAAAKIPFVTTIFIGDGPDVDAIQADNPYFVGAIDADLVADGRLIAEQALDNGGKKALIIGGNVGDNNMDQRIEGFQEVFEKGGGKIAATARCLSAEESPQKASDMLAANKDADVLYILTGDYTKASINAIDTLKLQDSIKVYMSCVDENSANLIKEGRIVSGNDGISLPAYLAPLLIHNWLSGNKILDENGKGPHLRTTAFKVDQSNADAYLSVFFSKDGKKPFTKEKLNELISPEATYETFTDLIDNGLKLNSFLELNGLPTI